MVITYYGALCAKVQSGETVLVFNPPSKNSEFKSPRFQANIVLVNADNKDCNGFENITAKDAGDGEPFLIDGAGEYEIAEISVKGVSLGLNTAYTLSLENITVCHLGDFDPKSLSVEAREEIGAVDILFIAADANGDVSDISQAISHLNPKIVIPVYRDQKGLKKFLSEEGVSEKEAMDKFTVKMKDLSEEKTQIIVLKPAI